MEKSEQIPGVPLIFVVGAPRSGTTLMANILGNHSSILSLGETHFFEDIWTRRNQIGDLREMAAREMAVSRILTLFERYNFPEAQRFVAVSGTQQGLLQQFDGTDGLSGLYAVFVQMLLDTATKQIFCDDTPKHLYYLDTIYNKFPQAKIIICVRDPRDFLHSYKNYWRKSTEGTRIKALYHPVITAALWRSAAMSSNKAAQTYSSDQILIITYESLVTQPEASVSHICDFLRISYEPEILNITANNSSFFEESSGIFANSVGRWHTGLPPEEVWLSQRLAGHLMDKFGYEAVSIRPSPLRLLHLIFTTPFALFRALYANRQKRGPLLNYMVRRLASFVGR